jgi:hypothetical protein
MRTALGYVHVSTDEQAERGLGLDAKCRCIQFQGILKRLEASK